MVKGIGCVLAFGVGLGLTADAAAQTPPEGIVWHVLSVLNGRYADNEDPTNRPPLLREVPAGVLSAVDVSRDGVADWRIDWPEDMAFCGTGGCRRTLYVSTSDGFVRAFDRQALGLDLKDEDGSNRVEAWLHSLNCSDGRDPCRVSWRWDTDPPGLVPLPGSSGDAPPVVNDDRGAETQR